MPPLELLERCATDVGFLASSTHVDNYHRVWARDGMIMGLAALASGDSRLIGTFRKTLETLASHQGPHGEIPSNVDCGSGRISYGGTAGRVDADLWFLIGAAEYVSHADNARFLDWLWPCLRRTEQLLGAWEFNNRGLIYVPQTGDWADEYIHSGYVLYDQLLNLQAQRGMLFLAERFGKDGPSGEERKERLGRLRRLIRANYWLSSNEAGSSEDIYHEVIHRKGADVVSRHEHRYWAPSFAPSGYGYRFDAFANILASLFGVSDERQAESVDEFVSSIVPGEMALLPAFHPVIRQVDDDWEDLRMLFSYSFQNEPYQYHNGGLWPMITGFHVASLSLRGKTSDARRFQKGIELANRMDADGESEVFPEFVHGREFTAGGTLFQGWSAAAEIIGRHALNGGGIFLTGGTDTSIGSE